MHDLILAKQIISEIQRIAKERKIGKIKGVKLEIGSVALAHNGLPEHMDEISPENLQFILEKLALNDGLEKVKFDIKKIPGDNWKIVNIETE